MSSNRLIYDTCEYQTRLNESANTLNYTLNPMRNENCNKCRMELGTVGGTNVSHIKGNLVDLETDLFGITRKASLCPTQNSLLHAHVEIWPTANLKILLSRAKTVVNSVLLTPHHFILNHVI